MINELEVIQLFDEEGNAVDFNVIAFFDMVNPETDEKLEYVIVQEQDMPDEDAIALRVTKDEDNEYIFEPIDDEVELASVEEAYNIIFNEEE